MNAQALDAGMPVAPFEDASCFHCGEAAKQGAVQAMAADGPRTFCCAGCAAAAAWIEQQSLSDYYRLRDERGGRAIVDAGDVLWNREEVLAAHARAVAGGFEVTLLTDGMRCAACAWLIDRALAREPGVRDVSANAVTGRVSLRWDPSRTRLSTVVGRLGALGYRAYLSSGEARETQRRAERNRSLLRLGVAGLGAMQAMMFAEALYLDSAHEMGIATRDFLRWVTFLLATPVVFYSGAPFLTGALRELQGRRLGMDVLIASSVLLAYFASLVETLRGGAQVWFDAAVMFVFLLLAARLLEARARAQASAQVDALARARPAFATRERADGARETVLPAHLAVGDVLCVAAGEGVAADGVLLDSDARFEEALLTGEPRPVHRVAGDTVFAGTTCVDQPARLRITAAGRATRLSQVEALVERAQRHRPALANAADRVAMYFVAALLVAATVTWLAWRQYDPSRAFEVALAVLVVSCPCALSLAVPTALVTAQGALARLGVLAVKPDALQRLARVSDVVFDKTGTLSTGHPTATLTQVFGEVTRDEAWRLAAALERDSRHPLARAFAHVDAPAATHTRVLGGRGLEACVDGRRVRIGRADFAAAQVDDGALWLGDGTHAFARFTIADAPRADAAATVARLRGMGLRVQIASGDALVAVQALAHATGVDVAHARQSAEDKLATVHALQADGRHVLMVGDGLNDAPVLAGADVSIAMGAGAALAHGAADFVLMGDSLQRVAQAVDVARRTREVVRQNFAWAVGYNLLALPLAAAGWVTPWLAALGMALSSLIVTFNALRLRGSAQ